MDSSLCQSCGLSLSDNFHGTEKSGQLTQEYCKFCYQDGEFLISDATVDDMIQMSINNLITIAGMTIEEAHLHAHAQIPQLKRWRK